MLEKKIEKKVCDYAQKKGLLTPKITVVGERGWPDRLFIDPDGWHVWVEFKAPGKQPRPIQLYRQEQLALRNTVVAVIDNEELGKELVDGMVAARVSDQGDKDASESGERRIILGPGTRED